MHKAKRKFGQNFLTDTNLLKKIVNDAHIDNKNVIEIGPGQGALTKHIVRRAKKMLAFEIDKDLVSYLTPFEEANDHLKIIYQDFLNTDLLAFHNDYFENEPVSLIGNLPYYITTPIIFKALEYDFIRDITIMIQKEVADRLIAKSNQKEYNALSLMIQYQASIRKIVDVNRQMFQPRPNVDSMVIQIKKFDKPIVSKDLEPLFIRIVKASFIQKRKTIVNNWHQELNLTKEDILDFLTQHNYKKTIRAEELSLEDFIDIASKWTFE